MNTNTTPANRTRYDRLYNRRDPKAILLALDAADMAQVDEEVLGHMPATFEPAPIVECESSFEADGLGVDSADDYGLDEDAAESLAQALDAYGDWAEPEYEPWHDDEPQRCEADVKDGVCMTPLSRVHGVCPRAAQHHYDAEADAVEVALEFEIQRAWLEERREMFLDEQAATEQRHDELQTLVGRTPYALGDWGGRLVSREEFGALVDEGFTYVVVNGPRVAEVGIRTPGMRVKHLAERLGLSNAAMIRALRDSGEWVNTEQSTVPTPVVREWLARGARLKSAAAQMAAVAGRRS